MGNKQDVLKEGVFTDWTSILGRELNTWYEHIRSPLVKPSGTDVNRVFSNDKISVSFKEATGECKNETLHVECDGKRDGVLCIKENKTTELILYHDDSYSILILGNPERTALSYYSTQKNLSAIQLDYAMKLTKAVGLTFQYSASVLNRLFSTNQPHVF
jgi:hypothetical protein